MGSAKDKRIYLTRHAEGEHNVACDYYIHDPPLTPLGRQQCQELNSKTKDTFQKTADLLVTSGLKRTLQTTIVGYPHLRKRLESQDTPVNVVVLPQIQECNDFPCDKGSDRDVLESDPEFAGLDFSLLTPDWNKKQGFYAPDTQSLKNRAKWSRRWLRERPEQNIVVVCHGDCLRYMTEGWNSGVHWANTEVNVYNFKDDNDEEAEMVFIERAIEADLDEPTSSGHL